MCRHKLFELDHSGWSDDEEEEEEDYVDDRELDSEIEEGPPLPIPEYDIPGWVGEDDSEPEFDFHRRGAEIEPALRIHLHNGHFDEAFILAMNMLQTGTLPERIYFSDQVLAVFRKFVALPIFDQNSISEAYSREEIEGLMRNTARMMGILHQKFEGALGSVQGGISWGPQGPSLEMLRDPHMHLVLETTLLSYLQSEKRIREH